MGEKEQKRERLWRAGVEGKRLKKPENWEQKGQTPQKNYEKKTVTATWVRGVAGCLHQVGHGKNWRVGVVGRFW